MPFISSLLTVAPRCYCYTDNATAGMYQFVNWDNIPDDGLPDIVSKVAYIDDNIFDRKRLYYKKGYSSITFMAKKTYSYNKPNRNYFQVLKYRMYGNKSILDKDKYLIKTKWVGDFI